MPDASLNLTKARVGRHGLRAQRAQAICGGRYTSSLQPHGKRNIFLTPASQGRASRGRRTRWAAWRNCRRVRFGGISRAALEDRRKVTESQGGSARWKRIMVQSHHLRRGRRSGAVIILRHDGLLPPLPDFSLGPSAPSAAAHASSSRGRGPPSPLSEASQPATRPLARSPIRLQLHESLHPFAPPTSPSSSLLTRKKASFAKRPSAAQKWRPASWVRTRSSRRTTAARTSARGWKSPSER